MTDKATTERAVRQVVKMLRSTRNGRMGLGAIALALVLGIAWIYGAANDAPASSAPVPAVSHEAPSDVSEAAYRAADRDAARISIPPRSSA